MSDACVSKCKLIYAFSECAFCPSDDDSNIFLHCYLILVHSNIVAIHHMVKFEFEIAIVFWLIKISDREKIYVFFLAVLMIYYADVHC